ncbi:MAG: polyisoprenoid-binding protein [Robiginitomaculum sp.]|nr:MAG: polyisoprenoid-binding protein [Robiginitomaculum sp.]
MKKLQKIMTSVVFGAGLVGIYACSPNEAKAHPGEHEEMKTKIVPKDVNALGAPSGTYVMDKTHGYVTFSYLHKGMSNPQLRFRDIDATLELDAKNPTKSQVNVTINAGSIDSGVDEFDKHLNGDGFFNTAEHATISFKSTSFTQATPKTGVMHGELTIMGHTKPLVLDVVLIGTKDGKKPGVGIEARGTLLRSDFGLGKYVPHVGDEVTLLISAEFYKK